MVLYRTVEKNLKMLKR